ncbi:MFS transporter [Paraburkholderia sp. Cy-641]|uniref:MFS transporter n=1 Tax=Paraburkholderia sp. Cy-641 TaxID=2608337 RepID=UPI00141D855E|nr:MFS transporter [Paraburkholderia sp. Cy-641]NIF80463.1 MFS transporter [Paraburkholderia sp. Cy-641]
MNISEPLGVPETLEQQTMHRVIWRIVPILMLGYFCANLDRANVGMAATAMMPALNLTTAQLGFGAGIFFLSYWLAEVPSNLMLNRFGARIWITRIMLSWAIVSALTAFAYDKWSFYGVRFILGLAEAGFFPGVLIYITWWFPARYRSRIVAWFMSAGILAQIIGPPIGGALMGMPRTLGLDGWQWLFIVEALPSILTAFLFLLFLTDRPKDARWLNSESRAWLEKQLAVEKEKQEEEQTFTLLSALVSPKVWLLSFVQFGHQYAGYGLLFFMPLIVKGMGVSHQWIGSVTAIPFILGFMFMIPWGASSDRTGERIWHSSVTLFVTAAAMLICKFLGASHSVWLMVVLCVAMIGQLSFAPCFWSIPASMLTGTAAAGGIALINALGNLGGLAGPAVYGSVRDATGSTNFALFCLAIGPLLSGFALLLIRNRRGSDQVRVERPATLESGR